MKALILEHEHDRRLLQIEDQQAERSIDSLAVPEESTDTEPLSVRGDGAEREISVRPESCAGYETFELEHGPALEIIQGHLFEKQGPAERGGVVDEIIHPFPVGADRGSHGCLFIGDLSQAEIVLYVAEPYVPLPDKNKLPGVGREHLSFRIYVVAAHCWIRGDLNHPQSRGRVIIQQVGSFPAFADYFTVYRGFGGVFPGDSIMLL